MRNLKRFQQFQKVTTMMLNMLAKKSVARGSFMAQWQLLASVTTSSSNRSTSAAAVLPQTVTHSLVTSRPAALAIGTLQIAALHSPGLTPTVLSTRSFNSTPLQFDTYPLNSTSLYVLLRMVVFLCYVASLGDELLVGFLDRDMTIFFNLLGLNTHRVVKRLQEQGTDSIH